MLAEVLSSEYLTNRALQELGYAESRINLAIRALFGPDPDAPDSGDFEVLADDLEPYVPSEADLAEYSAWSESLERQRERDTELAWIAMADAEHERRRFKEEELVHCGLPVG